MNHKRKDVNSDWLAGQWDERSVLGHARIRKGRTKGDDREIDTAQTSKRFDGNLALQEQIRKTFADSISNKVYKRKCEALLRSLHFLAFTLKMDRYQNASLSGLSIFVKGVRKLRFHSGAV